MKNAFLLLSISFIICYLAIPASHAIKMADPTTVDDGTIYNNDTPEAVNDKLLNNYVKNEPEESIKQEVKKNEWEAMNDNHNYDSYNAQDYGGEGDDDGVCEDEDNYTPDTYFDD